MTWAKYGTEFFDQLTEYRLPDALDDACQLTHTQAIHYLYSTEGMDLTFGKKSLRRFASSSQAEAAAAELVRRGVWKDLGDAYEVVHHGDVVRQSLGYQLHEREQAKHRKRKQRAKADAPTVTPTVTRDVTGDVLRTQTDSQTGNQPARTGRSSEPREASHQQSQPAAEVTHHENPNAPVDTWEVAPIPGSDPGPRRTTQSFAQRFGAMPR